MIVQKYVKQMIIIQNLNVMQMVIKYVNLVGVELNAIKVIE